MAAERKTIRVRALSRVEGEGGIFIELHGGAAVQVRVTIHEAPRFFEALLVGRPHKDVPDLTARICGICPVAYQMSSVHALEKIFGLRLEHPIRNLRRLFYCAEWIQSHALHMYLLNGPDFFGLDNAWASKDYLPVLAQGLAFKKLGNEILAVIGGRSVHSVSVCVGGFTQIPPRKRLLPVLPKLEDAFAESLKAILWAAALPFPDCTSDTEWVSLVHDDEYPMNEGVMGFSGGPRVPMDDFVRTVEEFQVAHSTALHAAIASPAGREPYLVGPLSRVNLNAPRLPKDILDTLKTAGLAVPIKNTRMAIVARAIELSYAIHEAWRIIREYQEPDKPCAEYDLVSGEAVWITEAPRGSLIHRYKVNEVGRIENCTIIAPTSQNLAHMERELRRYLAACGNLSAEILRKEAEKIVRCYDPCISCAVHLITAG